MVRTVLLAIAGVAAFAVAYVALAPREQRDLATPAGPAATAPAPVPAAQTAAAQTPAEIVGEIVSRSVRDVTPEDVTAGPLVNGPLTRVAAPARPVDPAPSPAARSQRLFNPIIASAGVIRARGREIRLAGIVAPEFEARCGQAASKWPCGRMARAALRRFVRGRAIECAIPAGAAAIPDAAECSVAGQDLAGWLVAQGWAKRDGDRYAEIEAAAREQRLGLWGDGRPDAHAVTAAGLESAPDSALAIRPRVSDTP